MSTPLERLRGIIVKDHALGLISDEECAALLLDLHRYNAEQEDKNERQSLVCISGGDVLRRDDNAGVLSMELTQSLKAVIESCRS